MFDMAPALSLTRWAAMIVPAAESGHAATTASSRALVMPLQLQKQSQGARSFVRSLKAAHDLTLKFDLRSHGWSTCCSTSELFYKHRTLTLRFKPCAL